MPSPTNNLRTCAACAEGHADAQLVFSLGDGESHDAVDADRGEEESEHGEGAEYEDGEAVGDKVFADDLVHGADVGHGEIGIHGTDGGGDAGGDGGRIAVGADGDGRVGPRGLVKGKVNFGGAGGCGMAFVLDVVEDANDLPFDGRAERGNLVGEQLDDFDALGERVESGKILAGEAFADHGDAGCSGEVARVEIAAAGEADAVGCVVARRDSINDGLRLLVDLLSESSEGCPAIVKWRRPAPSVGKPGAMPIFRTPGTAAIRSSNCW